MYAGIVMGGQRYKGLLDSPRVRERAGHQLDSESSHS